jgi:hypothetical protein
MQKILYLSLLCIGLSLPVRGQQAALTATYWVHEPAAASTPSKITPPKIHPPEMRETAEGILFRWEQPALPAGASVVYEFLLLDQAGSVVYSTVTAERSLNYSDASPPLTAYDTYRAIVNLRVTEGLASYVVPGDETAISFTYYPVCTKPANLRLSNQTEYSMEIAWDGKPAALGVVNYELRLRPAGQTGAWQTLQVYQGLSAVVQQLPPGVQYDIEVRKLCIWKDGAKVLSEPAFIIAGTKPLLPENGNCGDNYSFPPCTGPFSTAGGWTTLYIGGFSIQVLTLTPVMVINPLTEKRDTVWDGTGRLSLPFGGKKVKVQWDNVNITQAGFICGDVLGIPDAPQYWPDLNPAPAIWGDEICKPSPSAPGFDANGIHSETGLPWDPHGFGPTGTYDQQPPYPGYQPGMPFDSLLDPNGFNSLGVHFQTGTVYGPNGCTQNGLNAQGQPCDPDTIPYYWLQNNVPAEAANELLLEVQDSLAFWIQQKMLFWQNTFQDTIDATTTECNNIRGQMEGLLVALGYQSNRELIFGPEDEYFDVGMWKNFSSAPELLNVNIPRDPNQNLLESKHVDLYHCDKKLDTYATFKNIVDSLLQANSGVPDLVTVFGDKILELSEEQAQTFLDDRPAFLAWLYENLRDYISQTYCDGTCASPEARPRAQDGPGAPVRESWGAVPPGIAPGGFQPGGLMAAEGDPFGQILREAAEVTPEDIEFEFLQGWQFVNGIHRAYYLEAIGEARRMAASAPLITNHDPELMPIAVDNRPSDGRVYNVWLDQLKFTPSSAELDAYIVLELPNGGKKIALSAMNLAFTPLGLVSSPAKLQLANDVVVRLNNAVQITLNAGDSTYVSFDCDGYAGIGLSIDVEVCRNIVKPLDPATMEILPDPERVAAHIQVFLPTFDELYADISLDPFVINDLEDYKWRVMGVVLDFSDAQSPSYPPPPGYASPFVSGSNFSPLWRGFYIQTVAVEMPQHFNNNGQKMTVGVQHVVLDHMGVSGTVFATPLLPLDNGNAGGWAFSVDEFRLTVLANQPVNANFKGRIHVPIFSKGSSAPPPGGNPGGSLAKEGYYEGAESGACSTGAPTVDDCFAYEAFIEPASGSPKYRMTVNTNGNNWCVDMWKAGQVTINSGSQIDMLIENGEFFVKAKLNGTVKITDPLSGSLNVNIPNITFQNLILQNKEPYFSPGTWGFPNASVSADFGGFGINISNINMVESDGDPGLRFKAGIKIASGGVDLAAEGGFIIRGQMNTVNGRQRWVFKNFAVDQIMLDGSFSGVSRVHGILQFYDEDPTFGTGWRGGVSLTIKGMAEVTAVAQFGRITQPTNYKYFFIDALACLDRGWGTALVLKGFGGGVYFHMNRPGSAFSLPACSGPTQIPSGLGVSLSGIQYTPDPSKGVGIKATIALASAVKQNAFNGNATLELLFNDGGGISDLWIYGNARFMSIPQPTASPEKTTNNGASVAADLDMHFNFNTSTFDGNFQVFLNVAGGVVRGGGPNNRLGQAIIHVDPSTWYVKIGSPNSRCSLKISIPVIGDIANIGTYLQFGKGLDPMPPLPSDIAQLTGLNDYAGLSNRGAAMGGNGFIFGADFQIGNQDMEFLIFYAGLKVHLGFDVAILDYGPNAVCSNTGQQVGINGWYASGQVYAGIWGEMGIKVKIFGKKKKFKIFSVAVAAALQASLPNPFWAKGAVGGHYEILGGLIKGECHFDVTIGEKCQISGADDPLADLTVVQRIVPENNTTGVAVDSKPEVYFNFPIGGSFTIPDLDGNGASITYKATVDAVKLRHKGIEMNRDLEWAGDKRSLRIVPYWFLPGEDTVEIVIISHVDSNNIRIYDEERIAKIVTGPGLVHIPASNVKGSYPFDGQYNFYRNEIVNKKGYIMLHRGQPDLRTLSDEAGDKLAIRFQSSTGAKYDTPVAFTGFGATKIEFDLPSDFFTSGGIYRMQVVHKMSEEYTSNNGNNSSRPGGGGPAPSLPEDEILYTAYFRVSQYGTLMEKMTAWNTNKQSLPYTNFTVTSKSNMEPFDDFEMGKNGVEPLIKMRASLTGNSYYNTQIFPLIYKDYPLYHWGDKVTQYYRAGSDANIEFPPINGVFLRQDSPSIRIEEANWLSGSSPVGGNLDVKVSYEVFRYCNMDYLAFKEAVIEYVMINVPPSEIQEMHQCRNNNLLCNSGCHLLDDELKAFYCYAMGSGHYDIPAVPNGQYQIIVQYRLPGTTTGYGSEMMINVIK